MKVMSTLGLLTMCTGLVLAAAAPAGATPPRAQTGSFDLPGTDTQGAAGYCPFPVHVTFINNEKVTTTTLADGSVATRFTGTAFETATNALTGAFHEYTISGPGTVTTAPSGAFTIDGSGPNLFETTVANSAAGVPQLSYTTGRVLVSVDATGFTTSYHLSGHQTDVCAALG